MIDQSDHCQLDANRFTICFTILEMFLCQKCVIRTKFNDVFFPLRKKFILKTQLLPEANNASRSDIINALYIYLKMNQ